MDAKEAAREIESFVNGTSRGKMQEVAQQLACMHPTLQQNFTRFCMNFVECMANKDCFVDLRNQASVNLAREIMAIPLEKRILPFI